MKLLKQYFFTFIILLASNPVFAEFVNEPQTPGELLSKSHPELGRLTVIEVLGDYIIAIPEKPSSPLESDYLVRVLDISDPANPITVMTLGETQHPVLAHGTFKRANEVYIGGWPDDTVRLEEDGSLSHTTWSSVVPYWNHGGMFYPWGGSHWWSYDGIDGLAWITLGGYGPDDAITEWDHLGLTGVIGFPSFMGNLLIYASDQSMSGIATYDVSDPINPVLLDTFNLPPEHPEYTNWDGSQALPWGLGGYWSAIHSHYMVWARRGDNPGVQVVDFSDPTDLQLHCEIFFEDPALGIPEESTRDPMYPNFQDEYIFAERLKINIETCELELILDELGEIVETGQYARPIGNLLLTGGGSNYIFAGMGEIEGGLGIWAHQAEVDTRPPYVAYHIPQDGQTNYPTNLPYSLMIPETLQATTIIPGETLILEKVGGEEVPIDYLLNHTGILTVRALEELDLNSTYRMTLVNIEDAVHNKMEEYSFTFSTGSEVLIPPPVIDSLFVSNTNPLIDEVIDVTVQATSPESQLLEYRIRYSDELEYSNWTTVNTFNHTYDSVGNYSISVQVRDEYGSIVATNVSISVQEPVVINSSVVSSNVVSANGLIYTVNPDNNTYSIVDFDTLSVLNEVRVGKKPVSIAPSKYDEIWVLEERNYRVSVYDPTNTEIANINLGYGSKPSAIVIKDDYAYVSLEQTGQLVKIDTTTYEIINTLDGLEGITALSVSVDGLTILATRFVSPQHWGEVYVIDPAGMVLTDTVIIEQSLNPDDIDDGRGIPNHLAGITIDSAGKYAYFVGKKVNVSRGLLNGNESLDDDNTVRTFIGVIDINLGVELKDNRVDFDNADSPSAVILSPNEQYLFVTLQGNNQVAVMPVDNQTGVIGTKASSFITGLAPQGLTLDRENLKLYVKSFTGRELNQIDLTQFVTGSIVNPAIVSIPTVTDERLDAIVLTGKQIFYNASYGLDEEGEFTGRMSAEGYISCATCHFDGGDDRRVYDFTARGEGLRNNRTLQGLSGGVRIGSLHWSGNFDEVQDFELDIRNAFKGRGLMADEDFNTTADPNGLPKAGLSQDLDALSAYVSSLNVFTVPYSPYRNEDGSLTDSAKAGKEIFSDIGCSSCHSRSVYSNGNIYNVGTITKYSGTRLGEALEGFRTPPLIGLFNTYPYLHDGSAATLRDVFKTVGGDVYQAENLTQEGTELLESTGFSYFRDGKAVALNLNSALLLVENSTSNRTSYIRVRYGSTDSIGTLRIAVNGVIYEVSTKVLPSVEGNHTSFEYALFEVSFDEGDNEIVISSDVDIVIDDVIVSNEDTEGAAAPHLIFNSLTEEQQDQLLDFLSQIEIGGRDR